MYSDLLMFINNENIKEEKDEKYKKLDFIQLNNSEGLKPAYQFVMSSKLDRDVQKSILS